MTPRDDTTRLDALRRNWRRWVRVVELFALHRRGRHRVDARVYEELQRDLLGACRSLADTAEEARRSFYRGLESLVQPWLTPQALEKADRELLINLLLRCRQVGRDLAVRDWGSTCRSWVSAARLFLAVAAGVVLLSWGLSRAGLLALGELRDRSDALWFAVKGSSGVQPLTAAGIVITAVAVYLVRRSARA